MLMELALVVKDGLAGEAGERLVGVLQPVVLASCHYTRVIKRRMLQKSVPVGSEIEKSAKIDTTSIDYHCEVKLLNGFI